MSTTARLRLPYIAPQQAQKQVTYNEAMAALDRLVQPVVRSRTTTVPPGSPAEGDTYIVAPAATGAWSGKDGSVAAWLGGAWSFTTPAEGWLAYVLDSAELAVMQASAWTSFVTNGGTSLAKLGVNAVADLTSRLAVGADASVFTHAGASHRMSLNKAGTADTASLIYSTNFSGRAELGLTGDDAFHVKVSPNGTTWFEGLSIAQGSGTVSLPAGQLAFPATQNPSSNANTLDDYEEGTWAPVLTFGNATTGITYATQTGRYTKIGRLVSATANIALSSKGTATGSALVTGLPFTSVNDGGYGGVAMGYAAGIASIAGSVMMLVKPNDTRINIYQSNNGTGGSLTNSNFNNSSQLYFTAVYETA